MTDNYDRISGQLEGVALASRPTTIVEALPIVGKETTHIVRSAHLDGGTIVFLQAIDAEHSMRVVLPAKVVAAIVRQDAALRERAADRRSAERKRQDAERAKVRRAKSTLQKQRDARRARRERAAGVEAIGA